MLLLLKPHPFPGKKTQNIELVKLVKFRMHETKTEGQGGVKAITAFTQKTFVILNSEYACDYITNSTITEGLKK